MSDGQTAAALPRLLLLVSGLANARGLPFSIAMLYVPFPWAVGFHLFLAVLLFVLKHGATNTILSPTSRIRRSAPGAFCLEHPGHPCSGDVISPLSSAPSPTPSGDDMNLAFLVVSGMIFVGGPFGSHEIPGAGYQEALAGENDTPPGPPVWPDPRKWGFARRLFPLLPNSTSFYLPNLCAIST